MPAEPQHPEIHPVAAEVASGRDEAAGAEERPGCGCGCEDEEGASRGRWLTVAVSGLCTATGMLLHWTQALPAPAALTMLLAAIVAGIWYVVPEAWESLRHFSPDMNLLIAVAVAGAMALGDWEEAAVVVFLFSLAELLEALSLRRARHAVRSLLDLAPPTALVVEGDATVERPAAEVPAGACVFVKSGGRIPLDGEVLRGRSAVDQAPVTGEALPVEKGAGDAVFAGTIVREGSLEIRVTRPADDSLLVRIIRLVEEAQERRAPTERFVDAFARRYTPAVFALAALVAVVPPLAWGAMWSVWLYRALVLLVVACPCALVIATPVSIITALTALARRGVLVKGGVHLEALGALRALAVDKTGTLTAGEPRVRRVQALDGADEREVLRIAAALESHSDHPLAAAVVAAAGERRVEAPRSGSYRTHPGRGADGEIDGHRYFVGNHRFVHELGVCTPALEEHLAAIETEALSAVVVGHAPHDGCAGGVLGILAVGDALRPGAVDAVRALHDAGVRPIVMLSGDNRRTAAAIARQAGVDEVRGDLLPEDKVAEVSRLLARHGRVAMVGDGINDAPALAAATVGIAMGRTGTDVAIETADVALMKDDLSRVAEAVRFGRRTVGVIRFNIAFALGLKALIFGLALTGYASLWLAILADDGATLLVVANALRLLRSGRGSAGAAPLASRRPVQVSG